MLAVDIESVINSFLSLEGVRIFQLLPQIITQSDFGQLYKVKCENMKNLDCPSFPMVCRAMFWWSGPPGAKKNFNPRIKGGTTLKK